MIPETLLAILACPRCRGKLALERNELRCRSCSAMYPIHDGIPILTFKHPPADERQ